ncbi:unnamed protein product [Rotaria sp. Silwood1]|nr:unnamed protein product [Rotaria sp. Silwood1]
MKILFCLLLFILYNGLGNCAPPYFPPQIVFSFGIDQQIMAIDETNQRAYVTYRLNPPSRTTAFVMKNFPYAIPDSPESKSYVQLYELFPMNSCMYMTYWKYGGSELNWFPSHWNNGTSFEIKNYMNFTSEMIHSNDSSLDEDYWYSNVRCRTDSGQTYPCQEIYFKKNTDIPLRLLEVRRTNWRVIQVTIDFTVISIGKPGDKYFNSIPKQWSRTCLDINLGVLYYPQTIKINLEESTEIQVWLRTPPHQINGNDTLTIQWKPMNFTDSFEWTPKEFIFNTKNFQERQILTITRIKNTEQTLFIPVFYGGGFDLVSPQNYPIYIQ